jgi:ferredoxin-like protein FixX
MNIYVHEECAFARSKDSKLLVGIGPAVLSAYFRPVMARTDQHRVRAVTDFLKRGRHSGFCTARGGCRSAHACKKNLPHRFANPAHGKQNKTEQPSNRHRKTEPSSHTTKRKAASKPEPRRKHPPKKKSLHRCPGAWYWPSESMKLPISLLVCLQACSGRRLVCNYSVFYGQLCSGLPTWSRLVTRGLLASV